jgi:biopolymer transport protein ExbD
MEFEGRARIQSHLDIAPLIDIVFLLLVFFMLTSTFIVPEAIELELPDSSSTSVTDTRPIIVSMDKKTQLSLNGQRIELTQLRKAIELLLKQDATAAITLKTDAQTEVQQLLRVMDEIRLAGGSNVALATAQK